jgi:hypothetical protein
MRRQFTVSIKLSYSDSGIAPGWHYEVKGSSDGYNWISGPFKTMSRAFNDAAQTVKDHMKLLELSREP